jgi:hypothetical protein
MGGTQLFRKCLTALPTVPMIPDVTQTTTITAHAQPTSAGVSPGTTR